MKKAIHTLDEIRKFTKILGQSLFFPSSSLDEWIDREGIENFRLVKKDGAIMGGLTIQQVGQWFSGTEIPTAAVRCVAVSPEHRGLGVATQLLKATLQELYNEGIPLSTLYPSTQYLYRSIGYERAGSFIIYQLPTSSINICSRSINLQPLDLNSRDVIIDLYTQRARCTSGNLGRNLWMWNRALTPSHIEKVYAYLLQDGDKPVGYIVYNQKGESLENREIYVQDMVALTAEAGRRILTFFADHRFIVRRVYWNAGANDPLLCLLPSPSCSIFKSYHWMLRLVDFKKAIEMRSFPSALNIKLDLKIIDNILPWNNGLFVVEIVDGKATVSPGKEGKIHIDIRGMAALYSGFLSAHELQSTGYIAASMDDLSCLSLAFSGPSPWMSEMF